MSVGRVAADAGVSKPAIYLRYQSKRQLALAAIASLPAPREPSVRAGDSIARVAAILKGLAADLGDEGFGLAASVRISQGSFPELAAKFTGAYTRPRLEQLSAALQASGLEASKARAEAKQALGELYALHMMGGRPAKSWAQSTGARLLAVAD
jgi:AcrR family transcriptional regulator